MNPFRSRPLLPFSPLLLFLLLALPVAAQAPTPPMPLLRIGTWNLEFLGAEGNFRNNLPPRTDTDLQKIGAKVRELGVAVLAVQEVCGETPLRKVAAGAGASWQCVLGTTGGWDDGKTSQQIGFLYDTAVVDLLFAEELLSLPREVEGVPIFHRVPVTAGFRVKATGFDFRAVTVHLKAGQKPADAQKRRLEATFLYGWFTELQQQANEDEDRVLLGDFNCSFGAEPEAILENAGTLLWMQPATPAPTIMHFADPIDQVVVAPGFAEVRPDSLLVHGDYGGLDKEAWRKIYSDHYPVTVAIDVSKDADPSATFRRGGDQQALPVKGRPALTPGAKRTAANTSTPTTTGPVAWPPVAGAMIQVRGNDGMHCSGRLLQELPSGPGGWVVVATDSGIRAVPWGQVAWINLQ